MAVNWSQVAEILGATLQDTGAGIGGRQQGYVAELEAQKRKRAQELQQQQFGQQLSQAMLPQQDPRFPSPAGPGNAAPTFGAQAPDQAMIQALLARAPQGFDTGPALSLMGMQQRGQSEGADRLFRERQFGEQQRQFDVNQVADSERDVAATLARSLALGEQRNDNINQRNLTREQGDLNRRNQMDIANVRAESQLGSASNVQSVQPVGDGTMIKIYRNGTVERVDMDGRPVMGARNDPNAIYNQSAARSGGSAAGKQAESAPVLDANFQTIMSSLDAFEQPDVKSQASRAIGFSSYLPTIPGYNAEFRSRVAQLQGQTFLQAYNTLRGGGAITQVEGEKGEASIARLQAAQTPDEFYEALKEARITFGSLYAAAKQRADRGAVVPQMQRGGAQQPVSDGLTPEEQRELQELRTRFGGR